MKKLKYTFFTLPFCFINTFSTEAMLSARRLVYDQAPKTSPTTTSRFSSCLDLSTSRHHFSSSTTLFSPSQTFENIFSKIPHGTLMTVYTGSERPTSGKFDGHHQGAVFLQEVLDPTYPFPSESAIILTEKITAITSYTLDRKLFEEKESGPIPGFDDDFLSATIGHKVCLYDDNDYLLGKGRATKYDGQFLCLDDTHFISKKAIATFNVVEEEPAY